MEELSREEVEKHLNEIDVLVGDWNELKYNRRGGGEARYDWINHRAPDNALALHSFSRHVVGWLPSGEWTIVQFDNSNFFRSDELISLGVLLSRGGSFVDFSKSRSFILRIETKYEAVGRSNIELADLIHNLLLISGHAYIVSSASSCGEILSVQDGYVYFMSRNSNLDGAKQLLKNFESNPTGLPDWLSEFLETSGD